MTERFVCITKGDVLTVTCTEEMQKYISNLRGTTYGKIGKLIIRLANFGFIHNAHQFDKIRGTDCKHLYNFKLYSDQLRFFCYYNDKKRSDGRMDDVVIFDYVKKKEKNLPKRDCSIYCERMKRLGLD